MILDHASRECNMLDLKIDTSKLLGFRLIDDDSNISMELKLGAKVGLHGKEGIQGKN
jgi:hypothetical protein